MMTRFLVMDLVVRLLAKCLGLGEALGGQPPKYLWQSMPGMDILGA